MSTLYLNNPLDVKKSIGFADTLLRFTMSKLAKMLQLMFENIFLRITNGYPIQCK